MFMRKAIFAMNPEQRIDYFRSQICPLSPEDTETWGAHKEEHMRCRAGRSSFWISWDGTMCACGLTSFPKTFDAFDGKVMEHWQELTDAVRTETVLEGCGGCSMRNVCKPCVATVYAESGETYGKVPYMCRLAQCTTDLIKDYLKEHDHHEERTDT